MRFKNFINEVNLESEDQLNEYIHKNCKKYLKMISDFDEPFYRGIYQNRDKFGIRTVRKNRKPKGTDPHAFKKFNKWLESNRHNRRDQSISVISDFNATGLFGLLNFVFPIGNFSYSWVDAKDINDDDGRTGWSQFGVESFFDPDFYEYIIMNKPFEKYFHTDTGIKVAYENGYEVWINCKNYVFAKIDHFDWDEKDQILIDRGND